jgi:molybdate transport system substrate-binding protein
LVKHSKLAVIVAVVLVLIVFGGLLYVIFGRGGDSNVITRTIRGGSDSGGDRNTIAIYAPNALSKPLERVTTAFQQENPGTTFQFTLGPTAELTKRIGSGEAPSLYIDLQGTLRQVPGKLQPKEASIPFGYDIVQLAARKGNPKGVNGLDAFAAGSPVTSGICATQLPCGLADAQALQRAGVNAAPKVVASNVVELTDGIKNGSIDAVLLLRTDLRAILTSTVDVPIPAESRVRLDYHMTKFRSGGPTDQFVTWLQGSPSARNALRFAGLLSFYDP